MGLTGLYWSSTAYPNVNNAYLLAFDSANTYPSVYNARWRGFAVRWGGRKFTRSGGNSLAYGALRRIGDAGYYWYSTTRLDISNAYYLSIGNMETSPSNYYNRWDSYTTRCLSY